jgi:hypothetical protein
MFLLSCGIQLRRPHCCPCSMYAGHLLVCQCIRMLTMSRRLNVPNRVRNCVWIAICMPIIPLCARMLVYRALSPLHIFVLRGKAHPFPCLLCRYSGPVLCPLGSTSSANQSACTSCPAGFACPSRDPSSMTACQPGTYSIGGATTCTACSAGHACPHVDASTSTPCVSGSYSLGSAASCTVCPKGFRCSSPSAAPVVCLVGTYARAGASSCTVCPAGYACTTNGDDLRVCAEGTYSAVGQGWCSSCPPGYACPTPALSAPITCQV